MFRISSRLALTTLLALLLGGASLEAQSAKGTFRFGSVRFQPVDSFAFQVEGEKGSAPLTVVALTNFKIDRQAVLDAIDTGSALFAQAAQRETGDVVFVRLVSATHCGLGGYLSQKSQQLDLANSFAAKTVSSTAARVAGECSTLKPEKMFDDEYEFHLSYDLPVTAVPKPAALPAGGGEPGSTYIALLKGIQTKNWNGVRLHLRTDEVRSTAPTGSDIDFYFEGLALNYPKTATVTSGLRKGDLAQIELRGIDHDGKKIRGTVAMRRQDGSWRVVDQSLFFDE